MEASTGRAEEIRSSSPYLLLFFFVLVSFSSVITGAAAAADGDVTLPPLPQSEVEALSKIGAKLGKDIGEWNVTVRNCSALDGEVLNASNSDSFNKVTCNCSYIRSTVCHVTSIQLTRQNLTGMLPEEVVNLTYLRNLDLSQNYLSGQIPAVWASLRVFNLSLQGNRISGKIPKELGKMPLIKSLKIENNQLEGSIPTEMGDLSSLETLVISSNRFVGELPFSFAKFVKMKDFRMDGNNISGKIPEFIKNWISVNRIDMVGTSLVGPIPESISLLKNLTQLRVSDLQGPPGMTFPKLQNAKQLTELVLRNCLISGVIPSYIGTMEDLKVLDLSFNNLSGIIPSNFEELEALEYLYLTKNMLTGEIPLWMLRNRASNKINIDLSYNNFIGTAPSDCQEGNVNMVASFSTTIDDGITECLRKNFPCSTKPQYTSLFINCGGQNVSFEGNEYDKDTSQIGSSRFNLDKSERWAYSSTGDFTGNEDANFIATNTSILNMTNPDLYIEARLTPISLKYYGLCLENGNYSVKLHFAEIIFTNGKTYWSLGKRIFDVLIQGRKVLKDFNIQEEAGGSGQAIIKNFTAQVTDNTLEIHLYWAGKGTTSIPYQGNYGPLISAISVTQIESSEFGQERFKPTVGVIFAIVISFSVLSAFISILLWRTGYFCKPKKKKVDHDNLPVEHHYYFSIKDISAATENFRPENKIGEGGFGPVYKGMLGDGTEVAVKKLSPMSKQGSREFLNEIGMVSALQHPNLVKLFGCCIEGNQLLLVYEYMENNSLGRALFGKEEQRLKFDWKTRFMICLGVAKGLAFLHEESSLKIVHRDIKASNILLDKNLNPKISDFGLAKLDDEKEKTHISTRIAGTVGYMAPEYATRGYLTDKADVYSFGIVVLEIVSGKSNTKIIPTEEFFYLQDWALILFEQERLLELVDPDLGSNYSQEEALKLLTVCLLCIHPSPSQRPPMSDAVRMLVGEMLIPVPSRHHSVSEEWSHGALSIVPHSQEISTQRTDVDIPSADSSKYFYRDE